MTGTEYITASLRLRRASSISLRDERVKVRRSYANEKKGLLGAGRGVKRKK